jgi:hypothetical protein
MKSLGVSTFFGCAPKGLQAPFRFCDTPPALDALLFVERHPTPHAMAMQHTSGMQPRRIEANHFTAHTPQEKLSPIRKNVAAEFRKNRPPRPEGNGGFFYFVVSSGRGRRANASRGWAPGWRSSSVGASV